MKRNDRIRDEDNLTLLVGGSKTTLSIMDINNQTKEHGRLDTCTWDLHYKATNTIKQLDNTKNYDCLNKTCTVTTQQG